MSNVVYDFGIALMAEHNMWLSKSYELDCMPSYGRIYGWTPCPRCGGYYHRAKGHKCDSGLRRLWANVKRYELKLIEDLD